MKKISDIQTLRRVPCIQVTTPQGERFLFGTFKAIYEVFEYSEVGWALEYLWQVNARTRGRIVTPTGLIIDKVALYRLKQKRNNGKV